MDQELLADLQAKSEIAALRPEAADLCDVQVYRALMRSWADQLEAYGIYQAAPMDRIHILEQALYAEHYAAQKLVVMSPETKLLNALHSFCISRQIVLDECPIASIILPMSGGGEYLVPIQILKDAPPK